ncbi:MAG: DUF1501 domain-containing protein [Rubripirellula sp.]|jgi:hypothetical protein|nr:DUF1501 domain-containing protein [Rubripirellula sp.]
MSDQCTPSEHTFSRRQILGSLAGAAGISGLGGLLQPVVANEIAKNDKQVLFVWLDGAISQLESWDPKPNTRFGGPFRSIPTAIPGYHVSELMPRLAKLTNCLTIVRNMHTQDNSHSGGVPRILRGDPANRGVEYPYFGSAVAKLMGSGESGLPPYVWIKPGSGGFMPKNAGFLGPKFGALAFGDGKPPENFTRPDFLTKERDELRQQLRQRLSDRYATRRRKTANEAQSFVYDMAQKLMARTDLFDTTKLPQRDLDRYGRTELGQHMLVARNMLEAGVRFVQVTSYGWDTHGDHFNGSASLIPKFDMALASILEDLRERGMLDNVLVVAMSEFGRTPRINGHHGRDHYPEAWSLAMAGAGVVPGAVIGETDKEGVNVNSPQGYDIGNVFHTWYHALGIDSRREEFYNADQPLPIAHHEMHPIKEALA